MHQTGRWGQCVVRHGALGPVPLGVCRMHANFADLTPDGFEFWMTLSPQTSEPVRHAPVPPPEQNSGDTTRWGRGRTVELQSDIRALGRSGLSARVPECQKLKCRLDPDGKLLIYMPFKGLKSLPFPWKVSLPVWIRLMVIRYSRPQCYILQFSVLDNHCSQCDVQRVSQAGLALLTNLVPLVCSSNRKLRWPVLFVDTAPRAAAARCTSQPGFTKSGL